MTKAVEASQLPICGIVMPISMIDGCSESHWTDVFKIISEAVVEAGFSPNLVSNADEIGIIHRRIIQNLYENPIVVCDISGRNPNVMFELGMRLSFDKPTIIIKDDKTNYNFDTSPIEHLDYPRDLRFPRMIEFKTKLATKISATNQKAVSDPNYTTFLKHFGSFTVAKIEHKEIDGYEHVAEELKNIRSLVERRSILSMSENSPPVRSSRRLSRSEANIEVCLRDLTLREATKISNGIRSFPETESVGIINLGKNHFHLDVVAKPGFDIRNPDYMQRVDSLRSTAIRQGESSL